MPLRDISRVSCKACGATFETDALKVRSTVVVSFGDDFEQRGTKKLSQDLICPKCGESRSYTVRDVLNL
jgi:hypothetical protein